MSDGWFTPLDAEAVRQESQRYLEEVLRAYRGQRPQARFTGLATETDPGIASLYVFLSEQDPPAADDYCNWEHGWIEQEVPPVELPAWFGPFDRLHALTNEPLQILSAAEWDEVRRNETPVSDESAVADLVAQPPLFPGEAGGEQPFQPLLVLFARPDRYPEFVESALEEFAKPEIAEAARRHFRSRRVDAGLPENDALREKYNVNLSQLACYSCRGDLVGMIGGAATGDLAPFLERTIERSGQSYAERDAEQEARRRIHRRIDESLEVILQGTAAAAAELERGGVLAACGFVERPLLLVLSEDDDAQKGIQRVAALRG